MGRNDSGVTRGGGRACAAVEREGQDEAEVEHNLFGVIHLRVCGHNDIVIGASYGADRRLGGNSMRHRGLDEPEDTVCTCANGGEGTKNRARRAKKRQR